MKSNSTAPQSKNWLLARFRQWHTWVGLVAALFLLVVGTSGVVLNYKKPIFRALGLPDEKEKMTLSPGGKPSRDAAGGIDPLALPVTLQQALTIAAREMGAGPLERLELKDDGGVWLYKIKHRGGRELWLNAETGAHFTKGEYERAALMTGGRPEPRGTDWGKILIDLHTGKIGGDVGKAVMTAAAVLLLFLTLSGVYLYAKPLLLRRANAKAKARLAPLASPAATTIPPKRAAELAEA